VSGKHKRRAAAKPVLAMRAERDRPGIRWQIVCVAAVFLAANAIGLAGGFVLDDLPLIVDNARLHAISAIPSHFASTLWPDRPGLALYRPVTQTFWTLLWNAGGGVPFPFHLLNLVIGALVPVLLLWLLRAVKLAPSAAFAAALLFAVMPIHAEATASVIGSAELLAAAFGLASLLAFVRGRDWIALPLFALAVLSKEHAAALLAVGWLVTERPRARRWVAGAGAVAILAVVYWMRSRVAGGWPAVPAIDNATVLLPVGKRVLTALWVQCLYLWKMFVPVTLSADYSYRQIPLVMGLADPRAWAGVALIATSIVVVWRRGAAGAAVAAHWVLVLPTANLLFPVGTVMGERLAYLPSAAAAALAGLGIAEAARRLRARTVWPLFCVIIAVYGARTAIRTMDWRNSEVFYTKLVSTSPASAKSHYFLGAFLASRGDDARAVAEYDVAVAIYPAYSEAFHNRGNALARLGRTAEAAESFRNVLRFDPGHAGARQNLTAIEQGIPLNPPRKRM
jgi:hypothetical protein